VSFWPLGSPSSNATAVEPHAILSMDPARAAAASGRMAIGDLLIGVDGARIVGQVFETLLDMHVKSRTLSLMMILVMTLDRTFKK